MSKKMVRESCRLLPHKCVQVVLVCMYKVHMSTRYSGSFKISLKVNDRSDGYNVNVSEGGKHLYRCTVMQPPADRVAVDSPGAFDDAAIAALSFAENDGVDMSGAARDCEGYVTITRMRAAARA